MTPEILQALTSAKALPLPSEEMLSTNAFDDAFRRERIYRIASRDGGAEAIAESERRPVWGTAKGKQTQVRVSAPWTHAECAQACVGMNENFYFALRYSYGADTSKYWPLRSQLSAWSNEQREREGWDLTVATVYGHRRYITTLIEIFMMDEVYGGHGRIPIRIDFPAFGFHDTTPEALIRATLGITGSIWRRRVSPIYEAIRHEYMVWLAIGEGWMKPWLREYEAA